MSSTSLSERARAIEPRVNHTVIGGVRVLVGLMWLANLHWKVPPDFGEPTNSGLYKFFDSVTQNSPFAPFTWVVEQIVLPNFVFFGWFTLLAETAVAMLLIVGYRTRVAALFGAALAVPITLAVIYYDRADEWSWAYFMMIGLHLVVFATDAGRHGGLDGALARGEPAARRGLTVAGVSAMVIGVLGLFVARSVAFATSEVALLGSDAGFVDADGRLVRRWELKLLFFNPLWALLTIAFGVLLVIGARRVWAAYAGGAGFGVLAIVALALRTFDYARDDGVLQRISTGTNIAVWGGLAIVGLLLARQLTKPSASAGSPASTSSVEPGSEATSQTS
ncbi:hypothetical protein BH23ACT3_BH23ACT3_05960 [soil metagenome]